MKLHTRERGSGPVLFILHGLFGSGDNWNSVARGLEDRWRVVMPDLANHGQSPHTHTYTFDSMAADLFDTADDLGIKTFSLMGHSMGGKAAMVAALSDPRRIEKLIVADVAPRGYPPRHRKVIEAMKKVRSAQVGSRQEADRLMAEDIHDRMIRAFLLKNLVPDDNGYRWRLGLDTIDRTYDELIGWSEFESTFTRPTLFIGGGRSNYLAGQDEPEIRRLFPQARIVTLSEAGHWIHTDEPEQFLREVRQFLAPSE